MRAYSLACVMDCRCFSRFLLNFFDFSFCCPMHFTRRKNPCCTYEKNAKKFLKFLLTRCVARAIICKYAEKGMCGISSAG